MPVRIKGVKFRNPFYVSSGPTTMTIEQLERIRNAGWGGASLKLTVYPLPYINREPRYGYYEDKGFLVFTAEKRLVLDELLKLISLGKKRTPELVLFANITYAGDEGPEGWVKMARQCEDAGADIIELNMCCPNMSFNVEVSGASCEGPRTGASMGKNLSVAEEVVREVKSAVNVPLFLKLTPEGGQIGPVAKAAFASGADAVGGAANRLGIPPVNLDDPKKSEYHLQEEIGMACMNGPWLKPLALRDVYEIRKIVGKEKTVTATGGITTWQDAVEMAMCGADLIGMCTATLINGFDFLPGFVKGLRGYMSEKGYKKFSDMRDILVPAITSAPNLTIYPGHAELKESRPTAPCTFACPNSVPAQGYVRKVAEGKLEEAYRLIMSKSPLQSICGEVCDHPCEEACTRGLKDEPVMIRDIKRFVIETARKKGWKPEIPVKKASGKKQKAAVVGSGPAGLSAAYDLARAGYAVTVFEAEKTPGGMLRLAIPEFRLNPGTLDKEIDVIKKLGVKFKTSRRLGKDISLSSLKKDGFKAVFLALGAQESVKAGIPGEDAEGSVTSLELLKKISSGNKAAPCKRAVVIGGGFTAVDSARTLRRLGVKDVFVLYRRTREEMPASEEEIWEAEEEGIRIMYLVSPEEIVLEKGRVSGVKVKTHVLQCGKDASGRRCPEEVEGAGFKISADMAVWALGQKTLTRGVPAAGEGRLKAEPETGKTAVRGVFAGGDCVYGAKNIISAVAAGKRAAVSIDRLLSGKDSFLEYDPDEAEADKDAALRRNADMPRAARAAVRTLSPGGRVKNFREYRKPMTAAAAVEEAKRCLACGCGAGCEICKDICKMSAYLMSEAGRIEIDADKCVACGMCIHRCPNSVIDMKQTSNKPI